MRVAHSRRIEAMVLSARASELLRVVPFEAPADMSKFLLSPMQGCWCSSQCGRARPCRPASGWR